ncbi:hypothetical protein BDP27DRAFT_1540164 [Rhodocollybia butyracea]|uniref:RNase III domain-containing protein n=1 Tax=Rhodocollybia butyracea TaxID=206335 RepID=A0A9P5Q0A6_9AGAR|nr:hypothetical protein BDP27DRAFT_1540164 [Rhodocollybia butyracea]
MVLGRFPPYNDSSSSDPVFRIIRNFYSVLDISPRPLILAGLFRPTSLHSSVTFDSLALEAALHSKIYGLSADARAECLASPYTVGEIIVYYDTPRTLPITQLVRRLRSLKSTEPVVRSLYDHHQHVLFELGPCAADLVWRRGNDQNHLPSEFRQVLRDWNFTFPKIDVTSPGFNLTPKALKLVQILMYCQEFGKDFRGVIFVHQRIVAYMMERLLASLDTQLGFLRIHVLTGAQNAETALYDDVFRQFENGSCNLLIMTRSTEDLDIPKASVVIKFDLFDSQFSHVYALSRCRESSGHVITMVERNNSAHHNIVFRLSNVNPRVREWTNALCRTAQGSVAHETPYESGDPYLSDSEISGPLFIKDPTTSSEIYPRDATNALYLVCSGGSISAGEESVYTPMFEFDALDDGRFVCRAVGASQTMQAAWSTPSLTRAGARRLAAYDVCLGLYERGLLDSCVFPKSQTVTSEEPLPPIDHHLSGTRAYKKKSPTFWSNSALTSIKPLTRLYPVVISVESNSGSLPPHASLLLLTRQPLPSILAFNLFFAGLPTRVSLTRAEPFMVDERQIQNLHAYTLQLWRGITNKSYSCTFHESLVLCAPLDTDWSQNLECMSLPNVQNHISWASISALVEGWIVPLKYHSSDALKKDTEDALIQDRWTQFTRRYDVVNVRTDLNPLSKPLEPELASYDNLVEVCKAHRHGFEGLKDLKQPLLEVTASPTFKDRLKPAAGPFNSPTSMHKCQHFIPELCAKVNISASVYRTALLLPSIMQRLDDYLLVKELNAELFNHHISEALLHVALTASSAGIEYDYERLELLGDSFLKYLSSIYVFVMHPKADEGSMHNYRKLIISNKSLLKNSLAVGLPAFIQSKPFGFKTWNPSKFPPSVGAIDEFTEPKQPIEPKSRSRTPPLGNDASGSDVKHQGTSLKKAKNLVQRLGDKVIADVAEAIVGAALLSGGQDLALQVTKALKVPLSDVEKWSDLNQKAEAPPSPNSTQIKPSTIKAIEAIVGSHCRRPDLLLEALTHYSKNNMQSKGHERLEFIGDAILDFLVVQHVFHRHSRMSPGGLTLLKGAMVSNSALAAICVLSGLYQHLLFESATLAQDIRQYVSLLQRAQVDEYALAKKEGRSAGQYWHNIESPKVLSDAVESILGALYVSDGCSPAGAEKFFVKVFKPFYDRHISLQTLSHHPTKVLFELIQARGSCQRFELVKEHNEYLGKLLVHDVVLASCQDEAGISGAKVVSWFGLDALEGDPGFLARTCDCWNK